MDRIGIESLTAVSLTPLELVDLAAELDCGFIGISLSPFAVALEGIAQWSLRDPATRREFKMAMADHGLRLGLGQGFGIVPGKDVAEKEVDLDILRELGAATICGVSLDTDLGRSLDQLAKLADMAGKVGIEVALEFVPTCAIPDLPSALDALTRINASNMRLLIDTMHLVRSGGGAADLAALPSDLIGYVQISDVPLLPTMPVYLEEALLDRLVPGTGELPLADILAALPRDVPIGLEVPMSQRALSAGDARRHVRACVEGVRRLLPA
jgi:sugar phosphate isomerase/epimerase